MDCGAAAVTAVCRFHGLQVSVAEVRRAIGTTETGTSLAGIARGARALGLEARMVRALDRDLATLPLPAIVHVDGDHWVVLYDVEERHVRVADPRAGPLRLPRRQVKERWSGYAALLAPPTQSRTAVTR